MSEGAFAGIKRAVECAENPPRRVSVINGGAEYEAVGFVRLFDEGIYDVVVKGALPDFRAGAAADAVPYRIGAEVQNFRFDPLAVKGAGDFGKGGKGTAVFLRT